MTAKAFRPAKFFFEWFARDQLQSPIRVGVYPRRVAGLSLNVMLDSWWGPPHPAWPLAAGKLAQVSMPSGRDLSNDGSVRSGRKTHVLWFRHTS